jgi:hypothetical protein
VFDRDRLLSQFARVGSWLSARADCFSPLGEMSGHGFAIRMKAFCELCLLLEVAKAWGAWDTVPAGLRGLARSVVSDAGFQDQLLASPLSTALYITSMLPFGDTEPFRSIARHYKDACHPFDAEQQPFQLLAHVHACDALGLYDAGVATHEARAVAASSLRQPRAGLSSSTEGPYSLTHSAFYATRFGAKTVRVPEAVDGVIDVELCKAFFARDLDAALELVLARACLFHRLGERDIVVLETAFALLDSDGALRSPRHAATPDLGDWGACYHTMIVAGLVLVVLAFGAIPFDDAMAHDTGHMTGIARAMEAVGAVLGAIENGHVAVAARALPALDARAVRMIAPVFAYVSSLEQVRRAAGGTRLLGLSPSEFAGANLAFSEAAHRATSAPEPRCPEGRAPSSSSPA